MMLPPTYYARCTDTACTWNVDTNDEKYRTHLKAQHEARYGHTVQTTDYP